MVLSLIRHEFSIGICQKKVKRRSVRVDFIFSKGGGGNAVFLAMSVNQNGPATPSKKVRVQAVQSSEFRTEAQRAQRSFKDLTAPFSVAFVNFVRLKTAWDVRVL